MKGAAAVARVVPLRPDPWAKGRARRAPLSRHAKPAHKVVARMVLDTLTLASEDGLRAFWGLAVVLRAKLTPAERQGLAWAALTACDDEEAEDIAERVLEPSPGADWPLAPLFDLADEAAFWSGRASREELRAYLLACFRALPSKDQAEFLAFAQGRAAT